MQPGPFLRNTLFLTVPSLLLWAGCSSVGPGTVTRDRTDYGTAISTSWKEQTLLNIVKIRYADLPVFMDVAQVVSSYSLETGASVGGSAYPGVGSVDDNVSMGVSGKWTDRPTITYTPLTGEKYIKGIISPIPPKALFFLIQSGYAADGLLALSAQSLNGLPNRSLRIGTGHGASPDFLRSLQLIRKIQDTGSIGLRVEENTDKKETSVLFFRTASLDEETEADVTELKKLLQLTPDTRDFRLLYSPSSVHTGDELVVNTRSIVQIMTAMASHVDVPAEHASKGWTIPSLPPGTEDGLPMAIHSGKEKPENTFASVRYQDTWFWVDQSDIPTKRAFLFIIVLFSMTDTGPADPLPLITIPAS